ncbi:MAG TPA: hypothetical protein VFV67_18445 [Actinophytocola sp.]|uniref:hypothetical protein n=1 Tax=Actinophytocola sp. TaxID=1872138 RepID=UPI002DBE04DE|nr:hypothetical protein [Actinophytocola sp.]HEU5472631.1 hypothetical protein [Actinophytocola sp.]
MNELAPQKTSIPGRLVGIMIIAVFQALANGFLGFVILDAVSSRASHGASVDGAGLVYFIGYLSIVVAVTLLVCAALTPARFTWVRPTIITVESLGLIGGVINLFSGQILAVAGIALAIGVIVSLNRDEAREWFTR